MKNPLTLLGFAVGVTLLTGSAVASETVAAGALVPSAATAQTVSTFVDRYAVRETRKTPRNLASVSSAGHATDVTLYATADREVVFVSFRMGGEERIALVETVGGRVTRFTDFARGRPRRISDATAQVGDAQEQARALLSSVPAVGTVNFLRGTSANQKTDAQQQAGDLLQLPSSRMTIRNVPRSVGDSQKMAGALLTSSSGY
jgi:hypothetical protein